MKDNTKIYVYSKRGETELAISTRFTKEDVEFLRKLSNPSEFFTEVIRQARRRVKHGKATPRKIDLEKALIELGKRDGDITSESYAEYLEKKYGCFSRSSARDWLVTFEKDREITLITRTKNGKIYRLAT